MSYTYTKQDLALLKDLELSDSESDECNDRSMPYQSLEYSATAMESSVPVLDVKEDTYEEMSYTYTKQDLALLKDLELSDSESDECNDRSMPYQSLEYSATAMESSVPVLDVKEGMQVDSVSSRATPLPNIESAKMCEIGQDSYLKVEDNSMLAENPNFVGLNMKTSCSLCNKLKIECDENENQKEQQFHGKEILSEKQKQSNRYEEKKCKRISNREIGEKAAKRKRISDKEIGEKAAKQKRMSDKEIGEKAAKQKRMSDKEIGEKAAKQKRMSDKEIGEKAAKQKRMSDKEIGEKAAKQKRMSDKEIGEKAAKRKRMSDKEIGEKAAKHKRMSDKEIGEKSAKCKRMSDKEIGEKAAKQIRMSDKEIGEKAAKRKRMSDKEIGEKAAKHKRMSDKEIGEKSAKCKRMSDKEIGEKAAKQKWMSPLTMTLRSRCKVGTGETKGREVNEIKNKSKIKSSSEVTTDNIFVNSDDTVHAEKDKEINEIKDKSKIKSSSEVTTDNIFVNSDDTVHAEKDKEINEIKDKSKIKSSSEVTTDNIFVNSDDTVHAEKDKEINEIKDKSKIKSSSEVTTDNIFVNSDDTVHAEKDKEINEIKDKSKIKSSSEVTTDNIFVNSDDTVHAEKDKEINEIKDKSKIKSSSEVTTNNIFVNSDDTVHAEKDKEINEIKDKSKIKSSSEVTTDNIFVNSDDTVHAEKDKEINEIKDKSKIKSSSEVTTNNIFVNSDDTVHAEVEDVINENEADEICFFLPENMNQDDRLKVAEHFSKPNLNVTFETISDADLEQLVFNSLQLNEDLLTSPNTVGSKETNEMEFEDSMTISDDDSRPLTHTDEDLRPQNADLYNDNILFCFLPNAPSLGSPLDRKTEQKQSKIARQVLKPSALQMEVVLQKVNEISPEVLLGCSIKKIQTSGNYSKRIQDVILNWVLDVSINVTDIPKYEGYLPLLFNCLKLSIFNPHEKPPVKKLRALCKFYIMLSKKVGNKRGIYTLILYLVNSFPDQAALIILEVMDLWPEFIQASNFTSDPVLAGMVHFIFRMDAPETRTKLRCLQKKIASYDESEELGSMTRDEVTQMMLSTMMDGCTHNAACGLAIFTLVQDYQWYKDDVLSKFKEVMKSWRSVDVLIVAEIVAEIIRTVVYIALVLRDTIGEEAVRDAEEALELVDCYEDESVTIQLALNDGRFCIQTVQG